MVGDYIQAVEQALARVQRLTADIGEWSSVGRGHL